MGNLPHSGLAFLIWSWGSGTITAAFGLTDRPTCHSSEGAVVSGLGSPFILRRRRALTSCLLPLSPPRSPLVKAVFHTCRAMHASLSGKADGQQSSFCHCERASGHLWSSLNVSGAACDPALSHVSGGFSGPSGRCSALLGKSALTCLEPTQPVGLCERQTRQAAPFPRL